MPTAKKLVRTTILAALLLGVNLASLASLAPPAAAQTASDASKGRVVEFDITRFGDTLFTNVDGAFRVRMDEDGDVWYATEGGIVHVVTGTGQRELFTQFEGLPSSYTISLETGKGKVYAATDLGIGIIDRETKAITAITQENSPLHDFIVTDVALVGDDLWIGSQFNGLGIWNTTRPASDEGAWSFKNTSTTASFPTRIHRIVVEPQAVWLATGGDGAWRYDRAAKTWNVTIAADGLPGNQVSSVMELNGETWFATPRGLVRRDANGAFRTWNITHGIPANKVNDVDAIITQSGEREVFAATARGLWQINPRTFANVTYAQGYGILGSYIADNLPDPRGWVFGTSRGVSHYSFGNWSYYTTGPSSGHSWGPVSFGFTSASVGEQNGFVWFGSARGLSAYRPPSALGLGSWQNFGEWQDYPASVVNWIDNHQNITWFATNTGAFGFEHETGRWISRTVTNTRNLVYGLEADREELWIPLFGDGLIMVNLTTNVTRTWIPDTPSALPNHFLTDIRADGDVMWIGAGTGVIKLDRRTGLVVGNYGRSDGVPGNGIVFRVVPDGANLWIGTSTGGVARFDVASGKVTRVWNNTTVPDFPGGEVRAVHREGGRLWVGTTEGLARIDVTSGETTIYKQQPGGLVQTTVNGITSMDGILYLATLSGVQRVDIAKDEFFPMRDGPGVVRGATTTTTSASERVSVHIASPRDGGAVEGATQIRGSALAFGRSVDRVEVRIGTGDWQPATGTESWSFDWDPQGLPANTPVTISARATAGNATDTDEIAVTPLAPPTIPLTVQEIAPDQAFAGRPLRLGARVQGDEPLTANLFYKPQGTSNYVRLPLSRQGDLFSGTIPANDVREGEMRYYIEVQSGLRTANAGGTPEEPSIVDVAPAPRLAVSVEGPAVVDAFAGADVSFPLNVTNVGSEPALFTLSASGLRATWVELPIEDLALAPGESKVVTATLTVPAAAFADNTTLAFVARDKGGVADPATASVPVTIHADETPPTVTTTGTKGSVIPFPTALVVVAIALAVLSRRRAS